MMGGMTAEYTSSPYETAILQELGQLVLSASHSVNEHLLPVLGFARQLGAVHGADDDILTASVLKHDLGRNDEELNGTASAEASVWHAQILLTQIGFPAAKLATVLENIMDHDQPEVRPRHLEGRILKDADFLGGFGAAG